MTLRPRQMKLTPYSMSLGILYDKSVLSCTLAGNISFGSRKSMLSGAPWLYQSTTHNYAQPTMPCKGIGEACLRMLYRQSSIVSLSTSPTIRSCECSHQLDFPAGHPRKLSDCKLVEGPSMILYSPVVRKHGKGTAWISMVLKAGHFRYVIDVW
jgi:hypothetical protein